MDDGGSGHPFNRRSEGDGEGLMHGFTMGEPAFGAQYEAAAIQEIKRPEIPIVTETWHQLAHRCGTFLGKNRAVVVSRQTLVYLDVSCRRAPADPAGRDYPARLRIRVRGERDSSATRPAQLVRCRPRSWGGS